MTQTKSFLSFATKVVLLHTVTYFAFGLLMSNVFDYATIFATDPVIQNFMRPLDAHALLGLLLQPLRGFLFAVALWPFWSFISNRRHGWLLIWVLFVVFGILSPPAAAPSSIEGVLYTRIPLWYHLMGLPELLLQTLTFSAILPSWVKAPTAAASSNASSKLGQLLRAVVIGCLAYAGYAVGSLMTLLISSLRLSTSTGLAIDSGLLRANFAAGANNPKLQFMFVVALIVNMALIYAFERWPAKVRGLAFPVFLIVDSTVPYIYQSIVIGAHPGFLGSIAIGFLPALVIWIALGRRKEPPTETRSSLPADRPRDRALDARPAV